MERFSEGGGEADVGDGILGFGGGGGGGRFFC